MSSSTTPYNGLGALAAPYIVPPIAAGAAIIFAMRDMILKSALQKGLPPPQISHWEGILHGVKASPQIGSIVGVQMILQMLCERAFLERGYKEGFMLTLATSAIIGVGSSPLLAAFNGRTMGWGFMESMRKFGPKQSAAIVLQETGFVFSLSVGDRLAIIMKRYLGNNKGVECLAVFAAGGIGSLFGHAGNTALTRSQCGLPVTIRHLYLGVWRKAYGNAKFALCYKLFKETLNQIAFLKRGDKSQ